MTKERTRETLIYNVAVWLTTTQGWEQEDMLTALRCELGVSDKELEELMEVL